MSSRQLLRAIQALLFAALSLHLSSSVAWAQVRCEAGKQRSPDTAGHCCWPGQAWNGSRCVGAPISCPAGFQIDASGERCKKKVVTCKEGKVVVRGHCCWPDQAWSTQRNRCLGKPKCPPTHERKGEVCVPLKGEAAEIGRCKAGDMERCGFLAADYWFGENERRENRALALQLARRVCTDEQLKKTRSRGVVPGCGVLGLDQLERAKRRTEFLRAANVLKVGCLRHLRFEHLEVFVPKACQALIAMHDNKDSMKRGGVTRWDVMYAQQTLCNSVESRGEKRFWDHCPPTLESQRRLLLEEKDDKRREALEEAYFTLSTEYCANEKMPSVHRAASCLHLSRAQREGIGTKTNVSSATATLARACKLGSLRACAEHAQILAGRADVASWKAAAAKSKKACDAGVMIGCSVQAQLLEAGRGVPKNGAAARALHERACPRLGDGQQKGGEDATRVTESCRALFEAHRGGKQENFLGIPVAEEYLMLACGVGITDSQPHLPSCLDLQLYMAENGDIKAARKMAKKLCEERKHQPSCQAAARFKKMVAAARIEQAHKKCWKNPSNSNRGDLCQRLARLQVEAGDWKSAAAAYSTACRAGRLPACEEAADHYLDPRTPVPNRLTLARQMLERGCRQRKRSPFSPFGGAELCARMARLYEAGALGNRDLRRAREAARDACPDRERARLASWGEEIRAFRRSCGGIALYRASCTRRLKTLPITPRSYDLLEKHCALRDRFGGPREREQKAAARPQAAPAPRAERRSGSALPRDLFPIGDEASPSPALLEEGDTTEEDDPPPVGVAATVGTGLSFVGGSSARQATTAEFTTLLNLGPVHPEAGVSVGVENGSLAVLPGMRFSLGPAALRLAFPREVAPQDSWGWRVGAALRPRLSGELRLHLAVEYGGWFQEGRGTALAARLGVGYGF